VEHMTDHPLVGLYLIAIMKFPFVGQVISSDMENGGWIITEVTFPTSEDYLEGPFHTPGQVPFTIIIEAMAGSAGRLIGMMSEDNLIAMMVKVEKADMLVPVAAGERMLVRSELLGIQDTTGEKIGFARASIQAVVSDRPVADARISFLCVPTKGF